MPIDRKARAMRPTSFRHTIRSLERGRRRPWIVIATALAVLGAWVAWFLFARVPVYQTNISGRIESDAQAHPLESPLAGIVVSNGLRVSMRVAAGDPLIELDASSLRLELDGLRARTSSLEKELEAIDRTQAVERSFIAELENEGDLAVREAKTSLRGVKADRRLAARERKRAALLRRAGVSSESDLERASAHLSTSSADVDALGLRVNRLRSTGRLQLGERQVRLAELERDRAVVTGSVDATRTSIASLQHEIDRHIVRAPVAGTIGSLGAADVGSFLREGDPIAVLVPDGSLRAVAMFPASAAGRLGPGQEVLLRFPAYSWTEYGSRRGRVARVASEAQEDRLRVDIDIEGDPASRIRLEHGQIVIAEVRTETISPARLLLRNAGVLLDDGDAR
jgi:membrane fusion protein (multidrug efflux system)